MYIYIYLFIFYDNSTRKELIVDVHKYIGILGLTSEFQAIGHILYLSDIYIYIFKCLICPYILKQHISQ